MPRETKLPVKRRKIGVDPSFTTPVQALDEPRVSSRRQWSIVACDEGVYAPDSAVYMPHPTSAQKRNQGQALRLLKGPIFAIPDALAMPTKHWIPARSDPVPLSTTSYSLPPPNYCQDSICRPSRDRC